MLTPKQIKAARALLDWSQKVLGEKCDGVSEPTIKLIENEKIHSTPGTLGIIRKTFEDHGIEFLPQHGVRFRGNVIHEYQGQDGFRDFFDDIYSVARDAGGQICLFNGVPEKIINWLGKDWYELHSKRMLEIKDKLDFKIIIKEGNDAFIAGSFARYKWFPESDFHEDTIYVYGNKTAFIKFQSDSVEVKVLEDDGFAESFKTLFNIAWKNVAIDTK